MKAVVIAALLFTGAAHAQLAYKGLPLGSARDELTARYPSLECQAIPQQGRFARLGEELCRDRYCTGAACAASSKALSTYGGAPVWDVTFAIVGGGVGEMTARFASDAYTTLRDALREAHGPGKERLQPMQTLGGARVDSRVWEASVPGGSITLSERAGQLTEGAVEVRSTAFTAWSNRPGDARKNAGDT